MKFPKLPYSMLTALMVAMGPSKSSLASSCVKKTFDQAIQKADVIFLGKVTTVQYDPISQGKFKGMAGGGAFCGDKDLTFSVEQMWKGEQTDQIKVFSGDGCVRLGGYFKQGQTVLVYAFKSEEKLATSICNRTREKEEVVQNDLSFEEEIQKLNERFPKTK